MSNFLAKHRCYISSPIENASGGSEWRQELKGTLTNRFGIQVFDPYDDPKQQWAKRLTELRGKCDYEGMAEIAKMFVRKDLAIVDRSDFVIAYLPYKIPTTGTHHEIINSTNAKKPTLLVCPQGKSLVPLWYYGFIPTKYMFGSLDELYVYLQSVDEGCHKDDDRWSFVYGLV